MRTSWGPYPLLRRCESRDNRESGVCVTGSASVELAGCRLAGNQHDGLAVGGVDSTARAAACNFQVRVGNPGAAADEHLLPDIRLLPRP